MTQPKTNWLEQAKREIAEEWHEYQQSNPWCVGDRARWRKEKLDAERARNLELRWKPITESLSDRVLVTNNITARDAYGKMSHVWIGFILAADNPDCEGNWVTYGDDDRKIINLTHYCEIPQPTRTEP